MYAEHFRAVGHFRVTLCLCFKARVKIWKWVWFTWKWTCRGNIFIWMTAHEGSFWHIARGNSEIAHFTIFACNYLTSTLDYLTVMEPFWKDVITWWNIKRSDNINPSDTEILYGYIPESKSFYALNHYLLIAKYHIFRTRNQSESPSIKVFLVLLENKIKCERQMMIKNSNCRKYEAKWTTLCICDT